MLAKPGRYRQDDEHIAFWDRSFGASTTNLEKNPHVCMLFYDVVQER